MIENFEGKYLQSFEYETTAVSDGNIVGTCELGTATIQLINEENNYSSLKGTWIKTIHGSFYIYDVKPVQEKVNIKLECYDIKYKLDKLYDNTKHVFPCTLKEWRNSIFDDCGVKYSNSDFPNSNLVLEEQPYIQDGSSNRNVIQSIAQAGASWVETDSKDKFYFNWFTDIVHEVKDWSELTTEKEFSPKINTVVLGRGTVEDNIYYPPVKPNDVVEFRIDNNYILDSQDVDSIEDSRIKNIVAIYNQVVGMSYLVFNLKSYRIDNKLSIRLGDKVKFRDIWNKQFIAPIMKKKIVYLAGNVNDPDNYYVEISAEKLNETSTEYSYAVSIVDNINKVERKTDKNNEEILDLISKSNSHSSQLSQMSQNINGFNFTIKDIQNNISNLENNFKITIGGIEGVIDKTGNNLLYGTSLYDLSEWGHIFDSEEQINDVEVLDNDYTKSNFLSERAMNVNYTTFKSTTVDKNMKSLTLSMKVLNNLEMGYFNINVNERVNKEIINQINTDIYNDDYKNLDKFIITFPITNSDSVSFDGILQTKPILIGIDGYSIINEVEPTPKKGLYWIKESTDEIRRAKYNNDEFQNWELIPWTYTQAVNNSTLVDGINIPTIPTKGNIMIGDVKLEYGDIASDWSLNPNEFYGTNYKITEDGIEFQKGNEKTIHNEEGINIYKDNDLKTQINSKKVFSEKVECEELNVDGLITKKVGINEYIRFMRE